MKKLVFILILIIFIPISCKACIIINDLLILDNPFYFYVLNPRLIYHPKYGTIFPPNTKLYSFKINSRGFPDKEWIYEKKGKRMIILGDSQAAGVGLKNVEDRFSSILQRKLPGWEIMNASIPGWGTKNQYAFFSSEGQKYNPDIVLLAHYENDLVDNVNYYSTFATHIYNLLGWTYNYIIPPIALASYLFLDLGSKLSTELAKIRFRRWYLAYVILYTNNELAEEVWVEQLNLLKKFKEKAEQVGSNFIVMSIPLSLSLSKDLCLRVYSNFASIFNVSNLRLQCKIGTTTYNRLKYFFNEENIKNIMFQDYINSYQDPMTIFGMDKVHLNEVGHKIIADIIYEYLVSNGLQ